MLTIAFCDDNKDFLHTLTALLKDHLNTLELSYSLHCFYSGTSLIQHYESGYTHFDMVFLDIDMPEQDGLSTADALRKYDQQTLLVFLTSMADKVYDAFGYNAFKFIRKDLGARAFIDCFMECLTQKHLLEKTFTFPTDLGKVRFSEKDIVFFEIVARKFYIETLHKRYRLMVDCFDDILECLDNHPFFEMPNRSVLVNLRYIVHFSNQKNITLKALSKTYTFEVSRYKKHSFCAAFMRYIQ